MTMPDHLTRVDRPRSDLAETVQALFATWGLAADLAGGRLRRDGDVLAGITGLPVPPLNGVWTGSASPDPQQLGTLLDEVAIHGVAHCLQAPVAAADALREVLADRGMTAFRDEPLMRVDDLTSRPVAPPELTVRRARDEDLAAMIDISSAAFDSPRDMAAAFFAPLFWTTPAAIYVVGEVDGVAVSAATGIRVGDALGVFNVGTLGGYRRRGYGAAVTAEVLRLGAGAGARWAWLQSSPAGLGAYRGLGFRVVDTWRCWPAPGRQCPPDR